MHANLGYNIGICIIFDKLVQYTPYAITHATDGMICTCQCAFVCSFWPLAEHINGCRTCLSCSLLYQWPEAGLEEAHVGEGMVLTKCLVCSTCVPRVVTRTYV